MLLELLKVGGFAGWRTRVAEARAVLGTIENKQPTVDGYRQSFYRYVP